MIVFDIDGTLFNTLPGIFAALEDVFKKYNIGSFDRANGMKYIGPPIKKSLKEYAGLPDSIAEEATLYYREVYVKKYITKSSLYKGIPELLVYLKKEGHALSIATLKTKKQVDRLLDVTGVDKSFFDFVETALDNVNLKKSEMLTRIVNESNEAHVVMVGDTEGDYKAAEEAKTGFIGVTYGYGFKPDKTYGFPVVNNICELSIALKNMERGEK